VVNDPVMGGQSESRFGVDNARKLGIWEGEVKIVPFLKAPGFCNLQSPGLYKKADFPDLSGASGLVARMSSAASVGGVVGLSKFNVMLMTRGARHLMREGVYTANVTVGADMADIFVPWSAFVCTWRGQHVSWCPDLKTQLGKVDSVGFGTAFPGLPGPFHVEIESLAAGEPTPAVSSSEADAVVLTDFAGHTRHSWHAENDPVMGGQSSSSFSVADGYGVYKGSCRIVPKLNAPGFTIAMTESPLLGRFPDVSSMDGLLLGLRNAGGNITSFKVAFCDSHINLYRCQFGTFKADFSLPPSSDFKDVFVPWSAFSDKWSAYTGEHTAEEPPAASSLRSITQLQIWTEGVLGDFEVQVKYVKAAKKAETESAFQLLV